MSIRLTLGGGYGWLSSEHGLVIDNLLQVSFGAHILTAINDLRFASCQGYHGRRRRVHPYSKCYRKHRSVLGNPGWRLQLRCLHGVCVSVARPEPDRLLRDFNLSASVIGCSLGRDREVVHKQPFVQRVYYPNRVEGTSTRMRGMFNSTKGHQYKLIRGLLAGRNRCSLLQWV